MIYDSDSAKVCGMNFSIEVSSFRALDMYLCFLHTWNLELVQTCSSVEGEPTRPTKVSSYRALGDMTLIVEVWILLKYRHAEA